MSKDRRVKVHYSDIEIGGKSLIVERLNADTRPDLNLARGVQDVMRSAYGVHAEAGRINQQAVNENFSRGALAVRSRRKRMGSHLLRGSEYFIARDRSDDQNHQLVGLAKVTPRSETNDLYLNDVAVRSDDHQQGLGRALVHAALICQPEEILERPLALDGIADSPVNNWYEQEWGMIPDAIDPEGIPIASEYLASVAYVAPVELTVSGVIAVMEQRDPRLAGAVVTGM